MKLRATALIVVMLAWSVAASSARSDAIAISTGTCPPGLRHGVVRHGDACTPIACTTDADCGAGAACREIVECVRQEERVSPDGRVVLAHPVQVAVVHGLCHGADSCPGGDCRARHQCEPTSANAAWDPSQQSWTGTFLEAPPSPPVVSLPVTTPGAAPSARSGGCDVGGGTPFSLGVLGAAALFVLRGRRRRSGAAAAR